MLKFVKQYTSLLLPVTVVLHRVDLLDVPFLSRTLIQAELDWNECVYVTIEMSKRSYCCYGDVLSCLWLQDYDENEPSGRPW